MTSESQQTPSTEVQYTLYPLDIVYQDFYKTILSFVYSRVRSIQVAEDLTQQVFLKLADSKYVHEGNVRVHTSLSGLLFKIANNLVHDYYRKNKATGVDPETLGHMVATDDDLHEISIINERHEILKKLLDKLPPRQKLVMELRFFDELSIRETAKNMGISEGAVKQLQDRAIKALKKII